MKNQYSLWGLALLAIATSGCMSPDTPRLPVSWTTQDGNLDAPFEVPSSAFGSTVTSTFQAHSQALEGAASTGGAQDWQLKGMFGYFGITSNGLLGSLLFEGTPSIYALWEPVSAKPATFNSRLQKARAALSLHPGSTPADVSVQLEPAIRAALASGKISNEANFKQNVLKMGQRFQEISEALSLAQPGSGWSADTYRLQVEFSGSGDITPVIGVGGTVKLWFDWNRVGGSSSAIMAVKPSTPLSKNLQSFVSAVSLDLQQVVAENPQLGKSPYSLHEIKVEVGVSAEGDFGIATGSVNTTGAIIFSKTDTSSASQSFAASIAAEKPANLNPPDTISLIGTSPKSFAVASSAISPTTASLTGASATPLERTKFRAGLSRALKMGSYFAERAAAVPNTRWKISEIDTEFEISLGGKLGVVSVSGVGSIELAFSKNEG